MSEPKTCSKRGYDGPMPFHSCVTKTILDEIRASQPPQVGSEKIEDAKRRLSNLMSHEICTWTRNDKQDLQILITSLHQANERIAELGKDKQRMDFLQNVMTKDEIQDDKLASKIFHETKDLRLSIDAAMSSDLSKEGKKV